MLFEVDVDIRSGPDVRGWAETARITSIEFRPDNFLVRHTKETGPNAWPEVHIPGWGDGGADKGNIQWTLWAVIWADGGWRAAGCIEFWVDPTKGVNGPFSNAAKDWWYGFSGMAGHQPGPGDRVGFFVTAGDERNKDIESVQERSAIAWVTVPLGDTGLFQFSAPVPVSPTPEPLPTTPVPDWQIEAVLSRLSAIEDKLSKMVQVGATVEVTGVARFVGAVKSTGVVTSTGSP